MRKLFIGALTVAALGTAFVTPSYAKTPTAGAKCAFNSATDVSAEAGHQTGAWRAGVLITLEAGRLHCSIHVNNNTHDGAPAADPSASIDYVSTGDAVVIETPAPLNYAATAADTVSACAEWYPANGDPTLYWVSPNPLVPTDQGHWDTSATATCGEALSIEPNDPECRVWKSADNALGTTIIEDTWQDCEPYPPLI